MKISGKEFKKALQMAELTQEKAAEAIGVARQTVNTWVKSAELSPVVLDKIKTTLHIDLTAEKENELSQKGNNYLKGKIDNLSTQGVNFNDIGQLSKKFTYPENSTFPVDNKNMPNSENKGEAPQWRQLYNMQQEEINLLNRKIELLNQLIQR